LNCPVYIGGYHPSIPPEVSLVPPRWRLTIFIKDSPGDGGWTRTGAVAFMIAAQTTPLVLSDDGDYEAAPRQQSISSRVLTFVRSTGSPQVRPGDRVFCEWNNIGFVFGPFWASLERAVFDTERGRALRVLDLKPDLRSPRPIR
jgi:hypothetical protein